MKTKILSVTLAACVIAFPSNAAPSAGAPKRLFPCSLGAKRVTVTSVGSKIIYEFGAPNRVEMSIIGDSKSGNVFWHHEMYAHSYTSQLRFQNGPVGYVLHKRWSSPSYSGEGAEDSASLLVIRDDKRIARMDCKGTADFAMDAYDFESLPDDTTFDSF